MTLHVETFDIEGPLIVRPTVHPDDRGTFTEIFNSRAFEAQGLVPDYVQDNESLSTMAGTIRGLHFQVAPFEQAKLVRVTQGSAFDVALDVRPDSTTFGQHVTTILEAGDGRWFFLPAGFAHGFCTLEPNTRLCYKVSDYYSAESERSILWNDPALAIDWPSTALPDSASAKDASAPTLSSYRSSDE